MSFNLLGKEVSEQGSLDCPLQGFMGTSIACRQGARLPSWGQEPSFWDREHPRWHQEEPRPRGHQLYGRAQVTPCCGGQLQPPADTSEEANPIVPALQGSGMHGKSLFQAESCFMGRSAVTTLSRRERSQLRLCCFSIGRGWPGGWRGKSWPKTQPVP